MLLSHTHHTPDPSISVISERPDWGICLSDIAKFSYTLKMLKEKKKKSHSQASHRHTFFLDNANTRKDI